MKQILTTLLILLSSISFGQGLSVMDTDKEEPSIIVDVTAELPGGTHEYINKEIIYPEEAVNNNISGRVFVQYVVEKDGSLSELQVVKKLGFGCDEEAIRIFKNMPKWTPGKIDGKPVRQKMIFYVHFRQADQIDNK